MLCLMLLSLPARARDLFSDPCARAGIPRSLAVAIARQESSLNPFAVNVQGREIRPRSYEEAARIILEAHQAGKSYDVGIMQINSQWTRRWKMNPLDLLDPRVNIRLGVSILEQEIRRYGMGWLAVGKYHSPNLERGRRYAWRVYQHMKGKNDETLFASGKRRKKVLTAYITEMEYGEITASSARAGLSLSEFVRRVCLGNRIISREDQQARRELLKINADLGRLGGLLKQALSQGHKESIYGLLHKIDQVQALLKEKVKEL